MSMLVNEALSVARYPLTKEDSRVIETSPSLSDLSAVFEIVYTQRPLTVSLIHISRGERYRGWVANRMLIGRQSSCVKTDHSEDGQSRAYRIQDP